MKTIRDVVVQMNNIGVKNKFLIWPEIQALPGILFDDEVIHRVIKGGHPTGFAALIATDQRVILVDKVFFGLVVEDLPYESINSVKYSRSFLFGTVDVHVIDKIVTLNRVASLNIGEFVKFVQFKVQESIAKRPQPKHTQSITMDGSRLPNPMSGQTFGERRNNRIYATSSRADYSYD